MHFDEKRWRRRVGWAVGVFLAGASLNAWAAPPVPRDGAKLLAALKRASSLRGALALGRAMAKPGERLTVVDDAQRIIRGLHPNRARTGDRDMRERLLDANQVYERVKMDLYKGVKVKGLSEAAAVEQVAATTNFLGQNWGADPPPRLPASAWARIAPRPKGEATRAREQAYFAVMMTSRDLSRTVTQAKGHGGYRFDFAKERQLLAEQTAKNYEVAARLVIRHHHRLPLTYETARFLNRLLNRNTVMAHQLAKAGVRKFRSRYDQNARKEVFEWIASEDGQAMAKRDPVGFAEQVHWRANSGDQSRETFLDGNGRTWRLFADLALIKNGRAPVMYPKMEHYFAAGSPRYGGQRKTTREQLEQTFRDSAERGQRILDGD